MKAKIATIIRSIGAALALANSVLAIFGISPLPDTVIINTLTAVATTGFVVWAWWKNNSFTIEALEADDFLSVLKSKIAQSFNGIADGDPVEEAPQTETVDTIAGE